MLIKICPPPNMSFNLVKDRKVKAGRGYLRAIMPVYLLLPVISPGRVTSLWPTLEKWPIEIPFLQPIDL